MMNIFRVLTLAMGLSLLTPVQKSNAAIILGVTGAASESTVVLLGGIGVGVAFVGGGASVLLNKVETAQYSVIAGIAIYVLDATQEKVVRELSSFSPTTPNQLLEEIASTVLKTSKSLAPNDRGLVSVVLTKEQTQRLLAEYSYLDPSERAKLRQIMTTPIELKSL